MAKQKNKIVTKKIIIVGDQNVGKTSILKNIPNSRNYVVEQISANKFEIKMYTNHRTIQLIVWDGIVSGYKTDYKHIAYKDTDLVIVCYSVDSRTSFANVKAKWIPEIKLYCSNSTRHVLVSNKTDLRDVIKKDGMTDRNDDDDGSDGFISWKKGEHLAEELDSFAFIECSAVLKTGLENIVNIAVDVFVDRKKEKQKECTIL